MKTQMKRNLKMVAAMTIILSMIIGTVVCASDVSTRSIDASKAVSLSLSSGTAKSTCKVSGAQNTVTKIVINLYLQKKNSSGVWENYKSWYGTKSSYYYELTKSCSVAKGTYRVKARVICYSGSDAQTTYHYSNSKPY